MVCIFISNILDTLELNPWENTKTKLQILPKENMYILWKRQIKKLL